MPLASDVGSVSFDSQLTIDKIIRIFTGSYSSGDLITRVGDSGTAYVYRFPHGLPRPVFCEVVTSTDGGDTWDMGINKIAFSDSTYVYIFHGFATTGTPVVYKVYCSWIDDYDGSNPTVESATYSSHPIQFDSRLNYQKVYKQGTTATTTGLADEVTTIPHSLGYTPNVKIYFEAFTNEVWPLNFGGARNAFLYDGAQAEAKAEIYSNRIDVTTLAPIGTKIWYRIYYDAD